MNRFIDTFPLEERNRKILEKILSKVGWRLIPYTGQDGSGMICVLPGFEFWDIPEEKVPQEPSARFLSDHVDKDVIEDRSFDSFAEPLNYWLDEVIRMAEDGLYDEQGNYTFFLDREEMNYLFVQPARRSTDPDDPVAWIFNVVAKECWIDGWIDGPEEDRWKATSFYYSKPKAEAVEPNVEVSRITSPRLARLLLKEDYKFLTGGPEVISCYASETEARVETVDTLYYTLVIEQ